MTREIKFRGRNILNNDWMYGDLIHDDEHCRVYVYPRDAGPLELQHRVDAETIGQFTGLHDKNGKEIYEGDIVKTKYGRPCVIEWLSTICFVGFDLRPEVAKSKYKQPDGYDLYNSDNLEVIGNIYDDPELLKED